MTVTPNLVSEIVRAANRVPRLPKEERRQLLKREVAATGALRNLLTSTGKIAPFDHYTEHVIDDIARTVCSMSDETVAKALLALADQIRTLRIINSEPV